MARFEAQYGKGIRDDRRACARLKVAAESARHTLSEQASTTVYLPGLAVGRSIVPFKTELRGDALEASWAPLMARLRKPIEVAMGDARVTAGKLDAILLVGGATRMPRAGSLTPELLEAARARMAGLKLHPRDSLPNATALARAEALFVELTGDLRLRLADEIAVFRAVLEQQRTGEIAEARATLNGLTQAFKTQR